MLLVLHWNYELERDDNDAAHHATENDAGRRGEENERKPNFVLAEHYLVIPVEQVVDDILLRARIDCSTIVNAIRYKVCLVTDNVPLLLSHNNVLNNNFSVASGWNEHLAVRKAQQIVDEASVVSQSCNEFLRVLVNKRNDAGCGDKEISVILEPSRQTVEQKPLHTFNKWVDGCWENVKFVTWHNSR